MIKLSAYSICRLAHRVWQINKIPRDQLEDKLGLEIPPVPALSIGGITTTSILLHWLDSSETQTAAAYEIEVNGVKLGEFRHGDTAIEISGLKPGNCYSIRVTAVNTLGNSASATIVRVQTGVMKSSSRDVYSPDEDREAASLRTMSLQIGSLEAQSGSKDYCLSQHPISAHSTSRIDSESIFVDHQSDTFDSFPMETYKSESSDQIRQLTMQLESLKASKEEIDRQIEDDDVELRSQAVRQNMERDRLKQSHKEKEEASIELRKHGNHLDKLNRSAQSRKSNKEKQLQQKKTERLKIMDDKVRWEKDIVEMRDGINDMTNEIAQLVVQKSSFVAEQRQAIFDDQTAIKALEEEIRFKGNQIKALENRRDEAAPKGDDDDDRQQDQLKSSKKRDEAWDYRCQNMQAELAQWRQELQSVSLEEQRAKDVLNWWLEKRTKNSEQFTAMSTLDFPSLSRNRSRRSRHSNSRTSTVSSTNFQIRPASLGDDSVMIPPFSSATPFFNMGNGAVLPPGSSQLKPSNEDTDLLNGGALASPAANELLPSYLFRDEEAANQQLSAARRNSSGNSGNDSFFRHAVSTSDASMRGPNTPASSSSRGGSILPSPHGSMQNLPGYHSRSGTFDDNDHRSTRSIPNSLRASVGTESNPLGPNRFVNLFSSSFGRQRGKSSGQEPPPLGTLKQGQSQSFEIDDIGGRRRRGSHGYWTNPIGGLLTRNTTGPGGTVMTSSGRKSRLNMFGSKIDNLDSNAFPNPSSSSRPSSTYSHEGLLARPSSDSQHVVWPTSEALPNQASAVGSKWGTSGNPQWSHFASRRSSIEHGRTSNFALRDSSFEQDDFVSNLRKQKADQAPIGTRPQSSSWSATPKLNPAAPSFKTLFSRSDVRKTAKHEKSEKASEKMKEKEGEKADTDDGESCHESPPDSRRSRDAQSITTATSAGESYDSADRSISGIPSDAVNSSGPKEPKESLMRKITRKGSSGKFNVPWSKEKTGGGLFSKRAGDSFTPGEADEDTSAENQHGKFVESPSSIPPQEKAGRSSLSWPNIRRKSKRGDAVDRSSEAGDEEGPYDRLSSVQIP